MRNSKIASSLSENPYADESLNPYFVSTHATDSFQQIPIGTISKTTRSTITIKTYNDETLCIGKTI